VLSTKNCANNRVLESAVGKRTWGAVSGLGSFVSLELGAPSQRQSKVPHGEMHLWITNGSWDVIRNGQKLLRSDSTREAITKGINTLNGLVLLRASFDIEAFELRIEFSDSIHLIAQPSDNTTDEDWSLYFGDNEVFIAGPKPSLVRQKSDRAT